jgi:ferredoxin
MFCGLCEDACPVDALELTQDFEMANYSREGSSGTARRWKKVLSPTKGLKLNAVLTLRRLGSNTSLFLDSLLAKMQSGETLAKAWSIASQPEGKSVQPDVPHTISSLGRGSVVLK